MEFQIEKRGIDVDPEYTQISENVVLGSASWLDDDGRRHARYQVLTFHDGKIIDMQGFKSRRQAERFARSR